MIYQFSQYLITNRGLSQNTVKAYCEALHDFASFISDYHPGVRWSNVTKQMIDSYVTSMVDEGYQPASIKQHVSALRTFYKTCLALGAHCDNPARFVSTPRIKESLPKVIELEAIRAALADPSVSRQTKAAISIIFETGLRLQELIDLQPSDVDSSHHAITVHGKGGRVRVVYYGELTKAYGRCWRGAGRSQRSIRHDIFNALQPYSKAPQLSPHALRHTYASLMLENGASIELISRLLGHKHIATTEIYAHMSNSHAEQQYFQFAPSLK
jgi:site-specific recombinase XerD